MIQYQKHDSAIISYINSLFFRLLEDAIKVQIELITKFIGKIE